MFTTSIKSIVRAAPICCSAISSSGLFATQRRNLNIHEFQSQEILKKHGINIPEFAVARTPAEAKEAAQSLKTEELIIKAQVLAGGRGMGVFDTGLKGGVHACNSAEEVENYATKMLGHRLVTKQTGVEGKLVDKVMIAKRHYLRREMYFCIAFDRKTSGIALIGSSRGGMDIETTAEQDPSAIIRESIDIQKGLQFEQAKSVATNLGFTGSAKVKQATDQIMKLYDMFLATDCTQLEINPFVETSTGEVMCVDAKLNFDDNASYRQKEIFALKDDSQEDAREVQAAKYDLNFIGLDGSIGCLVNGAGLAMATMDIIKLYGGSPANFLDVGGGATESQVAEALSIIAGDPNVKAILINIFGGIMRCDVIALGILNAVEKTKLKVPLVVRLSGTNVEAARKLMDDSGLRVISASNLDEAAEKAVRVADIVTMASDAKLHVSFELPI